ncbi:putative HTH-type transcriptional regulator YybR [Flavobacterium bizetiae]|uniref:Putative HTH-type transcriptional regulator YybR n=1 Tax=Flavobacterium bizetiae TaxID=2704140 RepID=A0A6J4GCU3_9FLAO|nr:helix-turn-helix domain-containing protein [Flavobacterium bizetiae]CAA9196937.1 putative HTH-type transcriptional regulator YybR [Flavobacterium bizetiae]CAD5342535.1 putative HTH-type transcriptional regulator YybR [Flavobacterium bizetiae]CAD5348070.1 putative HTH-type transcriptional regulator YybR [Flavobacterium bizetiae]
MAKRKETSTNSENRNYFATCDLTYAVCLIGGRWKLLILCKLENGKLRFGELRDQICNITERMLTLQLRELERDGMVKRTVYAEVPPRVEYELTEISQKLIPIWEQLSKWGGKHKETMSQKSVVETEKLTEII